MRRWQSSGASGCYREFQCAERFGGAPRDNPRFVEAYLVGLNEGWRATGGGNFNRAEAAYFQNFWGAKADIPSIDGFDGAGHLGDHTSDHATGGKLVLLIRAELFRRYPSAVVSAVQAQWNGDGKTGLRDRQAISNFRGQIGPDVNFGSMWTIHAGRTIRRRNGRAGFVIEEHITGRASDWSRMRTPRPNRGMI